MKAVKKILALLLIACMAGFFASPRIQIGMAADSVDQLYTDIGNGFSYLYEKDSKTLIVRGPGVLPDLSQAVSGWSTLKTKVKTIILDNGITEIPEKAFAGCTALERVVFPGTLQVVASDAFEGCSRINRVEADMTAEALSDLIQASGSPELQTVTPAEVSRSDVDNSVKEVTDAVQKAQRDATGWRPWLNYYGNESGSGSGSSSGASSTTDPNVDEHGHVLHEVITQGPNGEQTVTNDYAYTYDDEGNVTAVTVVSKSSVGVTSTVTTNYDENGRPVTIERKTVDKLKNVVETKTTYKYAEDGSSTANATEAHFDSAGNLNSTTKRTEAYDKDHRLQTRSQFTERPDGTVSERSETKCEYGADGKIAKETMNGALADGTTIDRVTTFKNAVKDEVEEIRTQPSGSKRVFNAKHNNTTGQETSAETKIYDPSGNLTGTEKTVYETNPDGSRVAVITCYDADGKVTGTRRESATIGVPRAAAPAEEAKTAAPAGEKPADGAENTEAEEIVKSESEQEHDSKAAEQDAEKTKEETSISSEQASDADNAEKAQQNGDTAYNTESVSEKTDESNETAGTSDEQTGETGDASVEAQNGAYSADGDADSGMSDASDMVNPAPEEDEAGNQAIDEVGNGTTDGNENAAATEPVTGDPAPTENTDDTGDAGAAGSDGTPTEAAGAAGSDGTPTEDAGAAGSDAAPTGDAGAADSDAASTGDVGTAGNGDSPAPTGEAGNDTAPTGDAGAAGSDGTLTDDAGVTDSGVFPTEGVGEISGDMAQPVVSDDTGNGISATDAGTQE